MQCNTDIDADYRYKNPTNPGTLCWQETNNKALQQVKQVGITEPWKSAWMVWLVIVPKKWGVPMKFLCKLLNEVIWKHCYPLLRVAKSLDLFAGSPWFSSWTFIGVTGRCHWCQNPILRLIFTTEGFGNSKSAVSACNATATETYVQGTIKYFGWHSNPWQFLENLWVRVSVFMATLKLHPKKCNFMWWEVTRGFVAGGQRHQHREWEDPSYWRLGNIHWNSLRVFLG